MVGASCGARGPRASLGRPLNRNGLAYVGETRGEGDLRVKGSGGELASAIANRPEKFVKNLASAKAL